MNDSVLTHGFRLVNEKEVKEISSLSRRFIHEQSGAELLHFKNSDNNKVFVAGFKTPPENSYGIPHILEHCVLNGSRKFRCKEPFVELLKGSMQTFTNAMTYPDKTVYPVASTNPKDFFNLMDVYMDAVFFPNIYTNPDIFRQEGWHYELNNSDEELSIKGVVYNEMEGAFSSPEQILFRSVRKNLLPDTIYSHESGGDPDVIPKLTYEEFIAFHKKYYHPSNCKILLYGDGEIEEQLAFLNEGFLDQFQRKDMNHGSWIQDGVHGENSVELVYPLSEEESGKNKAYLNLSYVTGSYLKPESILGLEILEHILLGTPASPLKNALLKAKIGKDIFGQFDEELLQPIFSITVKHTDPEKRDEFEKIVRETLISLVEDGLNEKVVQASVNIKEFELREAEFGGFPKGLVFTLTALSHWMYSDNPLEILEFETPLKTIKEKVKKGYFESLIQKYLLDNSHKIMVTLLPEKGLTEKRIKDKTDHLEQFKAELTQNEINSFVEKTKSLKERQVSEDSEEDLKTIPLLNLSDLNKKAEAINLIHENIEDNLTLLHTGETRGIGYVRYFFDTTMIHQDQLPYLSLLISLLGKVSTTHYSYSELSNEILFHTGGIRFSMDTFQSVDSEEFHPKLTVYTKALNPKINEANRLISEIMSRTKFDERERIREILQELKSRMEMAIMHSGNQVASRRLISYLSSLGMYHEKIGGLEYYRFICQLEKDFDHQFERLKVTLKNISVSIFNKRNMVIGLVTENAEISNSRSNLKEFLSTVPNDKFKESPYQFSPEILNEGLATPSRVQYVTQGYNFRKMGFHYSGALTVFSRIAGLDYLWNKVRVQGGAYGSFVSLARNGDTVFSSYRDPNLKETLKAFHGIKDYLIRFDPTDREMRKYIIGSVSALDKPLTPVMKGSIGTARYFKKIDEELIQTHREEVMGTKPKHIREITDMITAVLDKEVICVVGNEGKLQEERSIFGEIIPVFN